MIYFIQTEDGPIKIGYTTSVKKRMNTLQTSSPKKLTLLAEMQGSRTFEREIHNKFHHIKMTGEWFRPEQELMNFIQDLKGTATATGERKIVLLPNLARQMVNMGENIKLARLRRNLSAAMIAERADITRTTLRSIERGDASVSIGNIAKVLFTLGLSEDLEKLGSDDILGRKLQDIGLSRKRISSK